MSIVGVETSPDTVVDATQEHDAIIIPFPERPVDHPEYVHGKFERTETYADELAIMPQVRGQRNPVIEGLKDSIETSGLYNGIDVARMTPEMLEEYIGFINRIWKSNVTMADYDGKQHADGFYYMVVAGHTRHQAITELELESRIPRRRLEVKIHDVTDPYDIMQIQLDENLHTQPPKERQATAIIEAYEWGVFAGLWSTQKEFLEQHPNIGRSQLGEALQLAHLPDEVRNFILAGKMPMNAGLALGRYARVVKEHLLETTGLDEATMDETQHAKVAENIKIKIVIEANKISKGKLNSTASEKMVNKLRSDLEKELANLRGDTKDKAKNTGSVELFSLYSVDELFEEDTASAKRRLADLVREYSRRPSESAAEMIDLNSTLLDNETLSSIKEEFVRSAEEAARRLGGVAAKPEADTLVLI